MESASSMEFSDVCWPADAQRKDFQLKLSPETGPKRALELSSFSPIAAANNAMLSTRSLDSPFSNGSHCLFNSFVHSALSSSLDGLECSYQNFHNDTRHTNELGKATKSVLSESLGDLTLELKEHKLLKNTRSHGAPSNKHTKHKSTRTRCITRDKTALPETSRRRKSKGLESEHERLDDRVGDCQKAQQGRKEEPAAPHTQRVAKAVDQQRSFRGSRQRRASTDGLLLKESTSKLSSRRRNSMTQGGASHRRLQRNVSTTQAAPYKPAPVPCIVATVMESPRRTKSASDKCERIDLGEFMRLSLSPSKTEESAAKMDKPFDTMGLSEVDKILVDDLWSSDPYVVFTALCELRMMLNVSKNEAIREVLHTGACSTLIGVSRKWNTHVGIQLESLRLLGVLLDDADDQFCLMVYHMGGLRLILSAMETFPGNESILEHSCAVLRFIVSINNKDPSVSFVRDLQGLPLLIQTMKNHPLHRAINKQASLAFCSMARVGSLRKYMEGMDWVRRVLEDPAGRLVRSPKAKAAHKTTTARGA